MSEETGRTSEGSGAIDLSKYVPKEEVGKLSQEIESLKKSLEDAKLELVSPEYVEFLSSKQNKKVTQGDIDKAKAAGLPQPFVEFMEEMRGKVVKMESVLQNYGAVLELQYIEKKFPDFDSYREQVQKLLENDKTGALSFEAAYWQAKGQNPRPPAGDKPASGNDKPGNFVPPGGSNKTFKNDAEASQDALTQIRTKYGITGDII